MMIDKKNKQELVYCRAFDRYLVEIFNHKITYPNKEIYTFDDDIKGAFSHLKHIIQILLQPFHL